VSVTDEMACTERTTRPIAHAPTMRRRWGRVTCYTGGIITTVEPFQALPGAFAQLRRVGEAVGRNRKRGEERDAAPTADGGERGTRGSGRLTHDGNLLNDWREHLITSGYVPVLLSFTRRVPF
jgi:hypothetical protein